MRVEATLLSYSRYLSEKDGGDRSRVISSRDNILSVVDGSIYDNEGYTVLYPEYYTTFDDPYTQRNYYEDLVWARENDAQMYSDLSRLAVTSYYNYQFKKNYYTPYFSMNFSVTKEIGDIASISFYANNFFNNYMQVYSSRTGNWETSRRYVTNFYYGLTLRLKF